MKTLSFIGILFIIGAIALLTPYNLLIIHFAYPDVLRLDTAEILLRFHAGGDALIWTWFAFALTGLPLLPAYILLGSKLETQSKLARLATNLGVIGLLVQMVGLLRWTFVVPVLADSFVNAPDEATKSAAVVSFKVIHQFGGVLLGEHLGQLFTIAWTILISIALGQVQLIPKWVCYLGLVASGIYLIAQGELLHTVMASMPFWEPAGFIGSTLWLIWLIIMGAFLMRKQESNSSVAR